MKGFGILLIIIGSIWGLVAFNLDTTVQTESMSIGDVYIPSRSVNNIGKMDERRNHLIAAGLALLIGVILFSSSKSKHSEEKTESNGTNQKCPACAEEIKAEANICRFCQLDLGSYQWKLDFRDEFHTHCPRCHRAVQLDSGELSGGQFACPVCTKTVKFSA